MIIKNLRAQGAAAAHLRRPPWGARSTNSIVYYLCVLYVYMYI